MKTLIIKTLMTLKPLLIVLAIVGLLQISGQWGYVQSFGQAAVLKTGVFNADAETEEAGSRPFNFNFDAFALDGTKLDGASLKGKVVFLNLWATWCGPCRAEMPTIQQLHNEIKDTNVVFVILSIDQGDRAMQKVNSYITKNQFTFPVYVHPTQPQGELAVPSIPTTYVISKSGTIAHTEVGMRNYNNERFKKYLLKLAAE
jgi:thiol-disulfide isomerase/thioredoxin